MSIITIKDIDVYLNNKHVRHTTDGGQRIEVPVVLDSGSDACIVIAAKEEVLTYFIDEGVVFSSTPSSIATPAITMLMALLNNEPCYFA